MVNVKQDTPLGKMMVMITCVIDDRGGGDDDDDDYDDDDDDDVRVLHKHLPICPGQVKVRFRQAFWETKKLQLPKSG